MDSDTIAFDTGLKYIGYLQNNIFGYDTAFIYNEYGLPVGPFADREVTSYDFDVTLTLEGCETDGFERYFAMDGEEISIRIIPEEGYELDTFTINGEERSFGDGTAVLEVRADISVVCRFRPVETQPPESSDDDSENSAGTSDSDSSVNSSEKTESIFSGSGGGCGSAAVPTIAFGLLSLFGLIASKGKRRK